MSGPLYCHFCEVWFLCGRPCKTKEKRDRCHEYRMIQEAKRLNVTFGRLITTTTQDANHD